MNHKKAARNHTAGINKTTAIIAVEKGRFIQVELHSLFCYSPTLIQHYHQFPITAQTIASGLALI